MLLNKRYLLRPLLLLSPADNTPQEFAYRYGDWAEHCGIVSEEIIALRAGPDYEYYHDVWEDVLHKFKFIKQGVRHRLLTTEDRGLFLYPTTIPWEDV